MQKTFFDQLGLRRVVNAAGKLTMLGASTQSAGVRAAMMEGAQNFVDLAELMTIADRRIAQATGAEGGFVTSCAAAGIAIATAACVTRGDPARSRDTGGAGLGLAVARAVVEQHDGTIECSSAPGEGTTVRMYWPAGRPAA